MDGLWIEFNVIMTGSLLTCPLLLWDRTTLQHLTLPSTTGEQGHRIILFPPPDSTISLFLSFLLDWWCKHFFFLSLFFIIMKWARGGGWRGLSAESWPVEEGTCHLEDLHVVLACKCLFSHPWSLPECPLVRDAFRLAEAHPEKQKYGIFSAWCFKFRNALIYLPYSDLIHGLTHSKSWWSRKIMKFGDTYLTNSASIIKLTWTL